jgi:hypothetical protein
MVEIQSPAATELYSAIVTAATPFAGLCCRWESAREDNTTNYEKAPNYNVTNKHDNTTNYEKTPNYNFDCCHLGS